MDSDKLPRLLASNLDWKANLAPIFSPDGLSEVDDFLSEATEWWKCSVSLEVKLEAMIACDSCDAWMHYSCENLKRKPIVDIYDCKKCTVDNLIL